MSLSTETDIMEEDMPMSIKEKGGDDEIAGGEKETHTDSDIDSNNYNNNNTNTTNKAGRVIKPPRPVTATLKVFDTAHHQLYNPYNPKLSYKDLKITDAFTRSFGIYDDYLLFMNPGHPEIKEIPFPGIRLDDRTAAKALDGLKRQSLHARWPTEFDTNGMIRATRIPLGHAAKSLVEVGDTDVDGNAIGAGQEGWYYLWWGGIHCLMGKEGYDAGLYLIRPSHDDFICPGLGFKFTRKAVVQLPSGDPNDPPSSNEGDQTRLEMVGAVRHGWRWQTRAARFWQMHTLLHSSPSPSGLP